MSVLPLDAGAVLIIELDGLEAGLDDLRREVKKLVRAARRVERPPRA